MQRYPLAIFSYGIFILTLIKQLKAEYPDVTQPWYSENSGALGKFSNIKLYFNSPKRFIPGRGYYPEPSKSVLIFHPDYPEAMKLFGLRHVFKV